MEIFSDTSMLTLPLFNGITKFKFIINFINKIGETKMVEFDLPLNFTDVIHPLFDRILDPCCRFSLNPFNSNCEWSESICCPLVYIIHKISSLLILQVNLSLEVYSFEDIIEDFLICMNYYKSLSSFDKTSSIDFLNVLFSFFSNF